MTTTAQHTGITAARAMVRVAMPPSLAVAAACALVGWLAVGPSGLWGAALGGGLVVVFFTLSLSVLALTRRLDPSLTLLVALGLYVAKVVALGAGLLVVAQTGLVGDPFHRTAVAASVIACTLTWTVAEIVASARHRQPLYDLGEATP